VSDTPAWILYGANGYTGSMIARLAVAEGMRPILAGRRSAAIEPLAEELGCPHRVFALDDVDHLAGAINGARAVLHCAGPFSATAQPMIEACLCSGVHYLDLTGEIASIELAASLDERARTAGAVLLPAVGFDVVPSDCLARQLADRLPDATHLELALWADGRMSPGTARTVAEGIAQGGRVRIDGEIQRVPLAWKSRQIPFADHTRWAMTIPWGDVASAYHSTGIGNIVVWGAASRRQINSVRRMRWLFQSLRIPLLLRALQRVIRRVSRGPSEKELDRTRSELWGQVRNDRGETAEATLTGPSGYRLTARAALASVQRILEDTVPPGFSTPALAFGKEFATTLPGVRIEWRK